MSWILNDEVLAVIAALIIVAGVFAGVQVFNAGRVVEPFSELGLLGPSGKIADYPKVVEAGQPFRLNVYLGNHEGRTMYYKVLVKLGDKNSTVNATTPLATTPILELRTVLPHNASQIIPLDIALENAGINLRLVFEMWTYNETEGAFTYHGRWNQLWLNVTEPSATNPTSNETRKRFLDPTLEEPLIKGYLAIRRAENNGGNITDMITLLNEAIAQAEEGNIDKTQSIIQQITSMEPEISRQGAEAAQFRLFMSIGGLATVTLIGAGSYIYLKQRFWTQLAKLYRNWKIKWKGKSIKGKSKTSKAEEAVKRLIKSNDPIQVEELVFSGKSGFKPNETARAVFRLLRDGVIELYDPEPPISFKKYITSIHGLGFLTATALVILCLFTVYFSWISPIISILRMALGSLFVLFLPGYSLVEALYPRTEELEPLERLALSIGLSLALVPLVGLALNYSPWGIRLNPVIAGLSLLTLGLLTLSAYRKYRILRKR
ncbi:DUF1616 domain-containing protein [Candidatus Bathyarchaeota archaeon]|nr:DUF1616 domain-containing protein [Candidatus Bathyarchaeota archaeon]